MSCYVSLRLPITRSNGEKQETNPKENTEDGSSSNEARENFNLSDEQMQVLPDNDKEEREILLTDKIIYAAKTKGKGSMTKNMKTRKNEDANFKEIVRLVEGQTSQINRIMAILRSVRHDTADLRNGAALTRGTSSEIKKLKHLVSQIQKQLAMKP